MAEFGKTCPLQNTDYYLVWKSIQKQLITIEFINKIFQESSLLVMKSFVLITRSHWKKRVGQKKSVTAKFMVKGKHDYMRKTDE